MSKIRDYFAKHELDGELVWPAEQEAKDELASDLLGAEIVSALDYWTDRADELLSSAEPASEYRRKNVTWEREMVLRRALSSLTADEKRAVARLVAETASGALFSTLVAFDQCAGIHITVDAHDLETDEKIASVLPGNLDLHDRLYEWIERFGERPQRFDPNANAG